MSALYGSQLFDVSSLVITAMRKDLLYHELLFVLLRNVLRINLSRLIFRVISKIVTSNEYIKGIWSGAEQSKVKV
jgi:hypothetical protein